MNPPFPAHRIHYHHRPHELPPLFLSNLYPSLPGLPPSLAPDPTLVTAPFFHGLNRIEAGLCLCLGSVRGGRASRSERGRAEL
jgi:hypothetical protein